MRSERHPLFKPKLYGLISRRERPIATEVIGVRMPVVGHLDTLKTKSAAFL